MTLRLLRIPAAFVFGTALLAIPGLAQSRNPAPASPYGGTPVEEIIARINDRIITRSDYDRAMKELDQEERQRGATMQEAADARKDLLRNLIDQQLWLSKGKELGITGETELVSRLNEIRKQYNLATLEDLEKAAQEQGVSYEDFKANIRNGIVTQDVMREEVGRRISITPGEAERYYEAHKQDYARQESVRLAEIMVSTGTPVPSATVPGEFQPTDPQKLDEAKAKAADIEAKLHSSGNFAQLAKSFSDGPTASEGGDLGQFRRGTLAKVLEDKVFSLKAGEYTEPIRTKQGYVILKVLEHTSGGVPPFKEVEQDVEQNYYMSKMEPAMRAYLTKMREEAYIDLKPGYVDTGASPNETKPVYSAYTPPAPKKKRKVERTRFRRTTHSFRQKSKPSEDAAAQAKAEDEKAKQEAQQASMKPGKKEKIRFGQAPQETLPSAAPTQTEDAGAVPEPALNEGQEQASATEEAAPPEKKTRFSDRARERDKKEQKAKAPKKDVLAPAAPDAAEVAARQVQSAPLGLGGDTANKKKSSATTTSEKTRLSDRNKKEDENKQPEGASQTPGSTGTTPATPAPQQ
jgi:peptidyl-prolyl cis-trans isomerase SurA